jgi:hypothetical protein
MSSTITDDCSDSFAIDCIMSSNVRDDIAKGYLQTLVCDFGWP